ncbi:MAG TPA: 2-isopropylmalate synthase [Gemmatimonadales bacterium]|jgi:2-isopropylmalate synthase|nr:2-isopropylmalate synthase [Gemmatimonadales bacterium]
MVRDVVIFDTTLRDGEQAPGNSLTAEEKLRLARQLDLLGVDVIEAGFPAASVGDFQSVREIAADLKRPIVAALARCVEQDIDLAGEALGAAARSRLHVFLSTSDLHLRDKLQIGRDEALELTHSGVQRARSFTDDVEFSAEDASRSDPDFLCRVVETAIAAGATTINLPDTVGYAVPAEYAAMFRSVRERVPGASGVSFSAHCHDDLGLAVANSLAALDAGAIQVECTINGIGERAGNAALEELVMAMAVRQQLGLRSHVVTRELYRTSQLLSYLTGVFPPPNKAIVGANAFAHEAGIHQHGMLRNGATYEIMRPETVGIPSSRLVLGKHSGRHALEHRYRELGYELDGAQLAELYRQFIALADRKRGILDEDLLALLHDSFHDAPEEYQLAGLEVVCGSVPAAATVRLLGPWQGERTAQGTGDGPIAAAFTAISAILRQEAEVISLQLRSVTPGRDSVGQVFLQARVDGKSLSGQGASTDIVEASARALVHALNKSRHAEQLESQALNDNSLWGV